MGALDLKSITKSFGATEVIKGVNLEVKEGEFCVFVGPSGCGKSTLLRIIAGLEDATSGDIELDGKRVNDIASYDALLKSMVAQMDNNLKLDCYRGNEGKVVME